MGNNRVRMLLSDAVGSNNQSERDAIRCFGVFELDLKAGELRRQGRKVKLQEQPFQVLSQLLERPGEVVTREELRNRLWPADTFVDFDHSLNAAIRRLRDALGDSAENPTFVQTVARRGYRFLAPVSLGAVNGNGSIHAPLTPPLQFPASGHSKRWWILVGLAVLALVSLSIVIGIVSMRHPAVPARITRLTANPVDDPVRAAAISRDGRYIAFYDETGFFLRQIETGETHSVPLPDGLAATSISWFPDSVHLIVALAGDHRDSSLWQISTMGGEPRKLVEDGRFPAVSPDGQQFAFIAGKALRERIWVAAIDGTQLQQLVGQDGDLFGGIAWSPNGQQLAYTTARFAYGRGVKAVINVIDVRAGTLTNLTARPSTVLSLVGLEGPIAWAPDGRLIYSVSEARPRQLDSNLFFSRIDRQNRMDGPPVRLTNDQGTVFSVSVAADSRRLIYLKGVPEPDVYVGALDASGSLTDPQRLTLDDRQDFPFDWTPDGKQVIFVSDRAGTFSIYKQGTDQVVPDMLVGGSQPLTEPRLSPDGSQLLYVAYPASGDSNVEVPLMRVPLVGGPPQVVVQANWISNHQCSRVPANVCVYSVVHDKDITFFAFDPLKGKGAQVFQITDDLSQLYNWSLSPDGSMLAMARGKWGDAEGPIRVVSLKGAPDRWITVKGNPNLASIDWAADSKSIWAATVGEKENELLRIDLRGNARAVWHPRKIRVGWAIPSRDGKKLALNVNSTTANIWMLEH